MVLGRFISDQGEVERCVSKTVRSFRNNHAAMYNQGSEKLRNLLEIPKGGFSLETSLMGMKTKTRMTQIRYFFVLLL